MKIVFTARGDDMTAAMDPRFGRAPWFLVYDDETEEVTAIDNRDSEQEAHGAGPKAAGRIEGLGADVLVTGNGPGGNAAAVLKRFGLTVHIGAGDLTVEQALAAYRSGELPRFAGV